MYILCCPVGGRNVQEWAGTSEFAPEIARRSQPAKTPQPQNIQGTTSAYCKQREEVEQVSRDGAFWNNQEVNKSQTTGSYLSQDLSAPPRYARAGEGAFSVIFQPPEFIMDPIPFCGLVDGPQHRYSRHHALGGSKGDRGGEVDKEITAATNKILEVGERGESNDIAYRLLLSCGKIYLKWPATGSLPLAGSESTLSGFWLHENMSQYFITACHFHQLNGESCPDDTTSNARLEELRDDGEQWGAGCYVGSRIEEECCGRFISEGFFGYKANELPGGDVVKVKLNAWNLSADTAVFEVVPSPSNAAVTNSATLADIGHIEDSDDQGTRPQVFTAGYCGTDSLLGHEHLTRRGMRKADADDIIRANPHTTAYEFYKQESRTMLGKFPSDSPNYHHANCLRNNDIKFLQVFRPNMRASATSTMDILRFPKRITQDTILTSTRLSLFHGLSGSPIVSFMPRRGWQIIAMVQGGKYAEPFNALTTFKKSYKTMLEELMT